MADFWIACWVFALGLVVGSFLNVCICRIPHDLSVVRPGSACPKCHHPISWFDNIPVVSYLCLGRKCRHCHEPISARYALVEMLTALIFVAVYFSFSAQFGWMILGWALAAALIVCTFIDFEHFIIPDEITLPGMGLGLLLHFAFSKALGLYPHAGHWGSLLWASVGALAGGGSLWLVAVVGEKAYGKEVMGMGDVKLMGMVGALLGWKSALFAIFLGSLAGSVVGIFLVITKKSQWQSRIPFGPYLSLGSLATMLVGQRLFAWYMSFLHISGS